ncbi:DHA2 family efflux MFS transporter permease subunit [Hippea alviniae]|uniref:DHA2 family efflux MFS transporter permease subunit n=1 Tax=Hippea alviniae TaxID=1279027 RepID=UPI0003B610BD|nr:DHA2 family efflux MFS transporter permease subunit [Hippea alviniae]
MQKNQQPSKWIIALAVILPTLMEIVDTTIVNVSLPHIRGALSISLDESTWVLTSYMVSNAIIIPITGWLAIKFGRKKYLMFSIFAFTFFSFLCGYAPSFYFLVLSRFVQGIAGGGLQPLSQAILLESFPKEQRGMAMAIFGMGVVVGPILGPVLGGWITDNWGWRWIFFINIPVGILSILLIELFVFDPEYLKKAKEKIESIDYMGLAFLAIAVGALQILLDNAQRKDWFESRFITTLAIISAVGFIMFIYNELKVEHPVVNLKIFKDRNYSLGNLVMFLGFFGFFGTIVLLPLYLQNLMGYTAFLAGLVLGPGALTTLIGMPLTGKLLEKGFDPRKLLLGSLIINAIAINIMAHFNLQADFWNVIYPRALQGFAIALFFVPLAAATFANISNEDMGNASGLFNFIRNIGGSFGTAIVMTILSRRAQFHQSRLVENLTPLNDGFNHTLDVLSLKLHDVMHQYAVIYKELLRQAYMLAFNDSFYFCAILFVVLIPTVFLIKKPSGSLDMSKMH